MLSKKELDSLRQRYEERSAQIRSASVDDLIRESPAEQEARIRRLLQPENYALFFDYYFGPSSALPLADHISAPFHVDIYRDLYQNNYITWITLRIIRVIICRIVMMTWKYLSLGVITLTIP